MRFMFYAGSAFINLHSMKTVSDVLAMLDHSDQVVNSTQFTGPQMAPIPLNATGTGKNIVGLTFALWCRTTKNAD